MYHVEELGRDRPCDISQGRSLRDTAFSSFGGYCTADPTEQCLLPLLQMRSASKWFQEA